MKQKNHYPAKIKVKIIREHHENQVSIGKLGEQHKLNPNLLYKWKKELFEGAEKIFSREAQRTEAQLEKKYKQLEEKLKQKDSLISELVADNIELKKKYKGLI